MLHRIQLPDCVPQLELIRQFQRDVLAFACSEHTVLPITEESLRASLGNDKGDWLWIKLWKQRGAPDETTFHIALAKLIQYIHDHPDIRQSVLDAFDHDVTFHLALDDPNFHFQYSTLTGELQAVLRNLMVSFYEDLLKAGFDTVIHGQLDRLDRDGFISSFWKKNKDLEVCPACDEKRSDVIDDKHFDDADHYLPKSKYPFLSLHHMNLVPLCLECNRLFKGDRDPIIDPMDAPLPNMFHPYGNVALDHIDVKIENNQSIRQIDFIDRDGSPSRRIESMKRVFRLHERWPDQLRYHVEVLRDEISDIGRRLRDDDALEENVKEQYRFELEQMLARRNKKIGKRIGYVLERSYLNFVLSDYGEFEELYEYFQAPQND